MKQLLFYGLLVLSLAGKTQDGFKLILIDNKDRSDTVVFGMADAATSGIDTELGEANIYGTKMDSLEIRSVQRDLTHHLCLTSSTFENTGDPFYFAENVDLKRDFRKLELFSPVNNYFEFTISAVEYPLTIISDFTHWRPPGTWAMSVGILNSECSEISPSYRNLNKVDTLIVDNDKSVKSIIVKFDHEVGVKDIPVSSAFNLYPNPITDKSTLIIYKASTENAIISIYTITGNMVYTEKLNGQKSIVINKSEFKNGFYLLRYTDKDGNIESSKVIIK